MKRQKKKSKVQPLLAHAPSITHPRTTLKRQVDWGGVRIVAPNELVPRLLPGAGARPRRVEMDLRSFVPSKPSVVVRSWVQARLDAAVKHHRWLEQAVRQAHARASFDTVAHLVADAVFAQIPYRARAGAAWQLPEETLARGVGDCEDRATLLASALVAAGISPYNVRVALGFVSAKKGARTTRHAHAWVVYRGDDGVWLALEPVAGDTAPTHRDLLLDYEPEFVFNGDHQWALGPRTSARRRARWNELDPKFHGEVHKSIVTQAAIEANVPEPLRTRLSRTFTTLFNNIIDEPDLRFTTYDPLDHFDSGLIDRSWGVVRGRLKRFYEASLTDADGINSVCWALHAIADFYAHSTYAHFLKKEKGVLKPFDAEGGTPTLAYDYAADATFSKAALSHYEPWWNPTMFDRLARWKGGPISGRYSLHGDSHGFIESITSLPPATSFPDPAARQLAGSLPHHDEIAVDEEGGTNAIYSANDHKEQYAWRYHLALRHMVAALKKHKQIGG